MRQIAENAGFDAGVVVNTIENAVSVASMLLTTEATISEIKEEKPAMPDMSGMGGMGGMGGMM